MVNLEKWDRLDKSDPQVSPAHRIPWPHQKEIPGSRVKLENPVHQERVV
jgi:hypothetical protein